MTSPGGTVGLAIGHSPMAGGAFGHEAVLWLGVACIGLSTPVVRAVIVEPAPRLVPVTAQAR